ncbi:DUF1345 domain-containing protein [Caulobacter sp. KR2-114]|uniref:DUF1345 domain-containing protein n=1 Tax=Caulobacter sp. KR2-114 TaxID=3400912 RepID=UPI003C024308
MKLHWRLGLGALIGVASWAAAILLGAPAPERALIGWNAGAAIYLLSVWRLFLTADEAHVRAAAAVQDERRGVILALALGAVAAALVAIVAALVGKGHRSPDASAAIAALSALTLITSWLVLQSLFASHYAHRHFQAVAEHGEAAGFKFPGDPPRGYMDFVYLAICIGATAQVSDPNVTTSRLRNLVTAHAAISFFYNTAVLAVGINLLSGLVGK